MKQYYIVIEGKPQGPFSLTDLENIIFDAQTPMWHEGLPDWTEAGKIDEIAAKFFSRNHPTVAPAEESAFAIYAESPSEHLRTETPNHNRHTQQVETEHVASYMGWAIAATVLCCLPLGIVAIFQSAAVNKALSRGDHAAALRASERSQWWIIGSITAGVVISPFISIIQSMML